MTITGIGLVVHGGKQAALAAAVRVREWATERGIPCRDVDVWNDGGRLSAQDEAERAGNPNLIVTVGGDGTFLRGARVAAPIGALVLGVNVGRVGFLTEVNVDQLDDALQAIGESRAHVDPRLMLTMRAARPLEVPEGMDSYLRYGRGPALPPPRVRPGLLSEPTWGVPLDIYALNDIVFEKLARDRQASIAVYVSGRLFASYSADALIVSTPTGSTAYSFAAGGPIVAPHLDALIFTPVAPHMVFNRSLVLAMDQRVGVTVLEHSGRVAITVDGQLRGVIEPGDWVSVYAGPHRSRLIRLNDAPFLDRVRDRFGLADARAAVADGQPAAIYDAGVPLPPDMAHPGPPADDSGSWIDDQKH
jgi:NAD+ kinase